MTEGSSRKVFSFAELGALGGLVLLWGLLCREILRNFSNELYHSASGPDAVGQLWMSWWASRVFASPALDLFHCPLINYPLGAEVFRFDVAFWHVLFSALLSPALGLVGAINGVFCVVSLFSVLGTYALLRCFTGGKILAAALAILPLFFLTGDVTRFPDLETANFGFLTLAMASWISVMKKQRRATSSALALLVALTCLGQMYYGISLMALLLLGLVASAMGQGPFGLPFGKMARLTLPPLLVGMLLAAPVLLPSLRSLAAVDSLTGGAFFRAPKTLPLFPAETLVPSGTGLDAMALAMLAPLALIAGFCRRRGRSVGFWVLGAFAFVVLGLGPYLHLGGGEGSAFFLPTPFLLMRNELPFFARLTFPSRFGLMAYLLVLVVLVEGQEALTRGGRAGIPCRVAGFCGFSLLAALLGPPMWGGSLAPASLRPIRTEVPFHPPAVYRSIAGQKGRFAVVDLSCGNQRVRAAAYQITHGKPIAGTPLFNRDQEGYAASALTRMQEDFCDKPASAKRLPLPPASWWTKAGARYLVLHHSFTRDAGEDFLVEWESRYGKAIHTGGMVRVYDLGAAKAAPPES